MKEVWNIMIASAGGDYWKKIGLAFLEMDYTRIHGSCLNLFRYNPFWENKDI